MTSEQILVFITAGKAIFTLESLKTGRHYTFKISAHPDKTMYWVSVLTDGDEYIYLGTIFPSEYGLGYKMTAKSKPSPLHDILTWFIRLLVEGHICTDLVFRHEGKCGACGRRLTTPESIDSGIGPVCASRI